MDHPFLVVHKECSEAVQWISDRLMQSGLDVVQTFDLQAAQFDHSLCNCPHHGTDLCDCQFVVLLIYENGDPPSSVIAHGHDGQTWFTLVDAPQQSKNNGIDDPIQDALIQVIFSMKPEDRVSAC